MKNILNEQFIKMACFLAKTTKFKCVQTSLQLLFLKKEILFLTVT